MLGQVFVATNVRATSVQTSWLLLVIGFSKPNFCLLLRLCSFDCMGHIKPNNGNYRAFSLKGHKASSRDCFCRDYLQDMGFCMGSVLNDTMKWESRTSWEQSKGQVEERISLQFRLFSHVPRVVPNWAVWWAVQVWEGMHWYALLEVSKAGIMSKNPAL